MAAVHTEHRVLRRLTGVFNPVVLRLAPYVPLYVVLEHRGRRSGRVFRTPLAGVQTDDGFLLPLAFGEQANWVLNLRQAGGAVVERRGRRMVVSDPEVVTWNEAKSSIPPMLRRVAPIFGVKRFLRVYAAKTPNRQPDAGESRTDRL
ncbi:MAG TPA: nitroreductase family deazaflavin-dependent oxidoreductase [Acidimicrobiales bacterium]|nr:nitroreductase family deazaflavin-dependent oxidoreductase [Acidimicrobiales bacterium]